MGRPCCRTFELLDCVAFVLVVYVTYKKKSALESMILVDADGERLVPTDRTMGSLNTGGDHSSGDTAVGMNKFLKPCQAGRCE